MNSYNHVPLYKLVITGILLWFVVFVLTPAFPTEKISFNTILFLSGLFFFYFLGYFGFKFIRNKVLKKKLNLNFELSTKFILSLILMVFSCWVLRYYDLLYVRGLSFYHEIDLNRNLSIMKTMNIIFIFSSVLKELYFIPLLMVLLKKERNIKLIVLSSLLFILPLGVPLLLGTRKDILLLCIYLLIILFLTKNIKLNMFFWFKIIGFFIFINVLFYYILINRESPKYETGSDIVMELIDKPIYNDLFEPNEKIKNAIANGNEFTRPMLFQYLHIGQYYCHGIFELNHLINIKIYKDQPLKGQFNFQSFLLFFNKLGVTHFDLEKIDNAIPRGNVFITFFGGLFIDFGLLGIFVMLLIGGLQNYIDFSILKGNYMFYGLYVFFVVFNILLPVINLMKGTGLYFVLANMLVLIGYKFLKKEVV